MSQSIYPTLITNTFIPSLWRSSSGQSITTSYLNNNFVRFPIAQGSQSFPSNLTVSGITNLGETNLQTRNSTQITAHFLNFSDSSSTGVGAIQKSANFSVVPSTGALTVSGLITATGGLTVASPNLIVANGGLTMGGANNITLGTGTTAPSTNQIGQVFTENIGLGTSIPLLVTVPADIKSLTVGRGVYAITINMVIQNTAGSGTTVVFGQLVVSRGGAAFDTENYISAPPTGPALGLTFTSITLTNIFTFTTTTNIIKLQSACLSGTAQVDSFQNYNFIRAVRIA
jgi:hypothetical protein